MSSPFKLIAVLVAAGFCVPAAFAADAVTSASVVPADLHFEFDRWFILQSG